MNRDEFLANADVKQFAEWAGHLVRGEWSLTHQWTTQERYGGSFRCHSLYEAYRGYSWWYFYIDKAMARIVDFRRRFDAICPIETRDQKRQFLNTAKEVAVDRGGSKHLNLHSSRQWGGMTLAKFQEHIDEIKEKLDPAKAATNDMPAALRMGVGFSKLYSMLIPGLPIYDSRVACALTCLVRLYQEDAGENVTGGALSFPVPEWRRYKGRGPNRCAWRRISHGEYAEANLKCAWLLGRLLEQPGDFAQVCETQRVDALQSALFMLGYQRLQNDAVVKP